MLFLFTSLALAQSFPTQSDHEMSPERIEPDFGSISMDLQTYDVVNGQTTSDFDAVGGLAAVDEEGWVYPFCSGTLVTDSLVLTAAHCVEALAEIPDNLDLMGFIFVVGTDMSESGIDELAWIDGAEMHPDYSSSTLANDVGLLQLTSPMETVEPMCLNPLEVTDAWLGVALDYVGWGITGVDATASAGVKRTVTVPVVDHDTTHIITYADGQNICSGDSGGAAIVELEDGRRMLAGVNSYGFNIYGASLDCDTDGAAGAAARVDAALPWITQYTGDITCDVQPDQPGEGEAQDDNEEGETPGMFGSGDREDEDEDEDEDEAKGGCGCASGGTPTGMLSALLGLMVLICRRGRREI